MSRALECLDEGLELARRIGDTRDEAHLLGTKADLFMDQGRWAEAIEFLTRTLPLAEESGVAPGIIEVHLFLGSAYEGAGQSEEALRHLGIADRLSQETQYSRFAPRVYLGMACVKAAQGEFDEARRLIGLAHDAAGPEPPDLFLGLMHRCFGHVQACCGNWDDAVTHLQESLEFLQRENLPAEVGRTCLSLGRAYASRDQEGDRGRAREHLLAAQCIFRQIEAQGYLLQVEEGLEKIGTRP
jgi:tetratricopeptide (TPR) repeat protein